MKSLFNKEEGECVLCHLTSNLVLLCISLCNKLFLLLFLSFPSEALSLNLKIICWGSWVNVLRNQCPAGSVSDACGFMSRRLKITLPRKLGPLVNPLPLHWWDVGELICAYQTTKCCDRLRCFNGKQNLRAAKVPVRRPNEGARWHLSRLSQLHLEGVSKVCWWSISLFPFCQVCLVDLENEIFMHCVRPASLIATIHPTEAQCWINRKAFILATCWAPFSKAESTHSNGYMIYLKVWRVGVIFTRFIRQGWFWVFQFYAYIILHCSNSRIVDTCNLFKN